MVRFIMFQVQKIINYKKKFTFQYGQIYYRLFYNESTQTSAIYIPIWLDLLLPTSDDGGITIKEFTFQYGQIYYLMTAEDLSLIGQDLHSNMVRFIIDLSQEHVFTAEAFTFQYGQIYYLKREKNGKMEILIYIPIWLDLL